MENHKFVLIKSILDLVFKIKLYYYDKHITLKEHNVFVRKNLTKNNIFILKVNNYYIFIIKHNITYYMYRSFYIYIFFVYFIYIYHSHIIL